MKIKKIAVILLTIVFIAAGLPNIVFASLADLDIVEGGSITAVPPAYLQEGEIWTGKTVQYNGDGTAVITLLAWGRTFIDECGATRMPLSPDYLTIADRLGDFSVDITALPNNVTPGLGNSVVWSVNQAQIIGMAPAQVSYTIYLEETPEVNRWYNSGTSTVTFSPVEGNPFYWFKQETLMYAFTMDMNWNNGNGLNRGTITDNILGINIYFGQNGVPADQTAASTPFPSGWNSGATADGGSFYWHLYWLSTNNPKTYVFTVRDLGGLGVDIIYEANFLTPGGNEAFPGSRTIVSETYMRRIHEPGNPGNPFNWQGNNISYELDVIAQVKFLQRPPKTTQLEIRKELAGYYAARDIGDDTTFYAQITLDGVVQTFEKSDNAFLLSVEGHLIAIPFSVNAPAVVLGLSIEGKYIVEEIFEEKPEYITVITTINDGIITFQNKYAPVDENGGEEKTATLEIHKELAGYYTDRGMDNDSLFFAQITLDDVVLTFEEVKLEAGGDAFLLSPDGDSSVIPFSVNAPAVVIGLSLEGQYVVQEVFEEKPEYITVTKVIDDGIITFQNKYDPVDENGGNENGGGGNGGNGGEENGETENGNGGSGSNSNQTTPPDRPIPLPIPEPELPPTIWDVFTRDHVWFVRGYENREVRPDNLITRAETAMIFFRLLRPELREIAVESPFTDVVGDEWYGLAIPVVNYHGIMNGFDTGAFLPDTPIIRREVLSILHRLGADVLIEFGVTPYLTRTEFVQIMNGLLERSILPENILPNVIAFPDLDGTHPAYACFMEAAHSHTYERHYDGLTEIWIKITEDGLDAPFNR